MIDAARAQIAGRSTTVSSLDMRAVRDARDVVAALHEVAVREAVGSPHRG